MKTFEITGSSLEREMAPTIRFGDTLLYDFRASKKLIVWCSQANIGILGKDGFRLLQTGLYPQPWIADHSRILNDATFVAKSVELSLKFMADAEQDGSDIVFEFLLVKEERSQPTD